MNHVIILGLELAKKFEFPAKNIHDTALGRYHDSIKNHDTALGRFQYWYHGNYCIAGFTFMKELFSIIRHSRQSIMNQSMALSPVSGVPRSRSEVRQALVLPRGASRRLPRHLRPARFFREAATEL